MDSAYSKVKKEIPKSLAKAAQSLGYGIEGLESTIDISKGFGDISCSASFRFAKEKKKDANSIANEIKSKLDKSDYIDTITVEGGFINFHLNKALFTKLVLETKIEPKKKKEKVIVEYVSVNPNKPWHVGHLRNALLGDSISNIYESLGYDVERENYIDDLGLQMAEITWWYLNKNNKPDKKFDQWLGEEYVKVSEALAKGAEAKEGTEQVLSLMGQDGTYESKMAREIATGCVMAQNSTAHNFLIFQDLMVWESDILREKLLEKALNMLKNYSFIETPKTGDYAKCTVINLKAIKNLPDQFKGLKEDVKVLIRI